MLEGYGRIKCVTILFQNCTQYRSETRVLNIKGACMASIVSLVVIRFNATALLRVKKGW